MTAWPAENKLAAPYHVSPAMTGFEELDLYGSSDTVPDCGAVWYPSSVPARWASCRDGQWVWVEPWGWTWVDAGLWGFAPLHYGLGPYRRSLGLGARQFWPCRVSAPELVALSRIRASACSCHLTLDRSAGSRWRRARFIGRATPRRGTESSNPSCSTASLLRT